MSLHLVINIFEGVNYQLLIYCSLDWEAECDYFDINTIYKAWFFNK